MIGRHDLDRTLVDWFDADAEARPPAGALELAIGATRRRQPRPAWLAPVGSHWPDAGVGPRSLESRSLARPAGALVLLVALLATMILVGAVLSQPSPVPSGRLAYALDDAVYLADGDGTDPVRVSLGTSDGPAGPCGGIALNDSPWAPDGRHLAFRTAWGGESECAGKVIIADASGRIVASVPGAGWLVAWAPDSARFATWVELGETIGVYGLDGTRHALLTVPPGLMAAGDFDPVWSPDGNALVVPSGVLVPLDGSQPVLLPRSDPRSDRVSAFSPDGTRAVFRGPDRSLILAAADGSGARRLLDPAESYSHLVWSPTGDHFAYAASRGTSTTVWVMDPVSGEIVRTVGIDGAGMWAFPIRFSPDGRSLLVGTLEDGGGGSLGTVGIDGTGYTELVAGTYSGDWQPPVAGHEVSAVPSIEPWPSLAAIPDASAGEAPGLGRFPEMPTDPVQGQLADALQGVLDKAVGRGLPGIAATVLVGGIGAWSGAAGTADGVHPVDIDSQFAIASITKTVIAAEILRLVETGRLRLDDPVSEHLPASFRFDTNGATIGNLLAMESGIPDPALGPTAPEVLADPSREWTAEEVLASVPAHRSPPGVGFVYEDANFMLLGLVIEAATGMSVADALRSGVLADPRVARLVYQPEERPEGPLALPFIAGRVSADFEAGGGYLPNRSQASDGSGSGGMASDAPALATWGYLVFGGGLLGVSSLAAMTDFGLGAEYDRYGLGVFDQTALAAGYPAPAVGNGGWDDGGYSSVLTVLPSTATVIAVLTNQAGSPVDLVVPVAQDLAAALGMDGAAR